VSKHKYKIMKSSIAKSSVRNREEIEVESSRPVSTTTTTNQNTFGSVLVPSRIVNESNTARNSAVYERRRSISSWTIAAHNQLYSNRQSHLARRQRIAKGLAKLERRNHRRIERLREYQRLRSLVPSIANKSNVAKVTIIEEAARYIDQLEIAVMNKLREKAKSLQIKGDEEIDVNSKIGQNDIHKLVQGFLLSKNCTGNEIKSQPKTDSS